MSGAELLPLQMERIAQSSGEWNELEKQVTDSYAGAFKIIANTPSNVKLRHRLFHYFYKEYPRMTSPKASHSNRVIWAHLEMKVWMDPWMKTFLQISPMDYLPRAAAHCPILAINGSKDMQVPSTENLALMRQAFKNANPKCEVKELEGLNHLFQECKTGSPKEYAKIEQTMSVGVITEMLNWITKIFN
jgi:hypothetical protein